MSQGTEHHVEEAEHAQHAARDPFDRRVALSMAIVAAALASVTLLSHRSHNEVTVKKTEESDAWNYYQAKKNRGYMYAADAELLAALSKEAPDRSLNLQPCPTQALILKSLNFSLTPLPVANSLRITLRNCIRSSMWCFPTP